MLPKNLPEDVDWSFVVEGFKSFTADDLQATLPLRHHTEFRRGAKVACVRPARLVETVPSIVENIQLVELEFSPATIALKLGKKSLAVYGRAHGIHFPARWTVDEMQEQFRLHECSNSCRNPTLLLTPASSDTFVEDYEDDGKPIPWPPLDANDLQTKFPPKVPTLKDKVRMMRGFLEGCTEEKLKQHHCAVCAQLKSMDDLLSLDGNRLSLLPLINEHCAFRERRSEQDPVEYIREPILAPGSDMICQDCHQSLENGARPRLALANNLWLGEVPECLKILTYAEQLLVARIRHNRSVVRVSSGHSKMIANVVSYPNPTPRIYAKLPPHRRDLHDVLVFIFVGVQPPTDDDFKRTPIVVRRRVVLEALEWLCLNHCDYSDVVIDQEALDSYGDDGPPVQVLYHPITDAEGNLIPSAVSVHETDLEQGSEEGPCPYRIHGLTEDRHQAMTVDERKAEALKFLRQGGAAVAVGHEEDPESIYRNPGLYPQMFPWLFPTGFGTIGNPDLKGVISDTTHKRWLLNYYDKRFQNDGSFVIVAFNHEQVKACSNRSFILAKRKDFDAIARKVRDIHPMALNDISARMKEGNKVVPQTDEERKCFALLDMITKVSTGVSGSLADKKNYRSELWSLTYFEGPPSWFITLAPTDHRNPLCVYMCNSKFKLNGHLLPSGVRQTMTSMNPVACAKFFDHVVEMFIVHILGWKNPSGGRYGDVKAYYAMVEQQGRMTLHLHAVVWIRGALSPTEIRRRLLDENSQFRKELIAYLEDCQVGNFMTGTMEDVLEKLEHEQENNASYVDPTICVPPMPPAFSCSEEAECHCDECQGLDAWFEDFKLRVDDILMRCNRHTTCEARKDNLNNEVRVDPRSIKGKGCINKDGVCTARFPRPTFKESSIDSKDGHINLKKLESMMNSVTPELSYVLACNTDVSSLLSGTAMKAVIGYVTDYITKGSLKTYQIFSTSYDVFNRNEDLQKEELSVEKERDAARKLIMKVSNSLTAKTEIGAPMAALYLLGNPDRYTSHTFVPFFWRSYFNYVVAFFKGFEEAQDQGDEQDTDESDSGNLRVEEQPDEAESDDDSDSDDEAEPDTLIPMRRVGGAYIGKSNVDDYRYRPHKFVNLSLYEWIQCAVRSKEGQSGDNGRSNRAGLCFYRYMEGHPLRDSHWVTADPLRRTTVVPNFLGYMIPRADEGDLEEYCCAMLTIFKPWRTPFDLKTASQTWEEAFDDYDFSARDRRLMANLNLRYECYDARDDYAAQLAKSAIPAMNDDDVEQLNNEENEDIYGVDEDSADFFMEESGRTKDNDAAMASAQFTLLQAGWDVPKGSSEHDEKLHELKGNEEVVMGRNLTTEGWKRLVTKERKKAQQKKFGMPLVSADSDEPLDDDDNAWYSSNSMTRVFVVPGCYLTQDFKLPEGIPGTTGMDLQTSLRTSYSLNYEQEKAFNIITNHALTPGAEQLKMYIGGMGGTGKSQVLRAVIEFFRQRLEDYRIVVLAPTGNAAALIDGSTYHSYLKIYPGERVKDKPNKVDELRTQLRMVDYIFIDEISMMSCFDMFKVSERLMDATGVKDKPFGGMNMIFAGDFAQLPPTTGYSLYSSRVAEYQSPRQTLTEQNNTIGKRAWLQVTTVVILKENMRQSSQSPDDVKLRRALQNLRYHDCDEEDIQFLRTRIPKNNPTIDMNEDQFRYAAVITALNVHKDGLNDVYSQRFSREYGKRLYSFYSIDKPGSESPVGKRRNFAGKKARMTTISEKLQKILWGQAGNTSRNIPGCLRICMDMPVCIRYNVATELCMTKGQEGTVVGWTSKRHPHYPSVQCLEVLFIKLTNPPKSIKLPYLPENVVPLTKISTQVRARWRNDFSTMINRTQMPVLPNFSMTDYASQGKTREANVVDLVNCRNFQAVYTCLSRGKTAAGTVIIQDFDEAKLKGKLDKDLRVEYRDLGRLDEITDMVYRGNVPDGILYNTRRGTLEAYAEWNALNAADGDGEATVQTGNKRGYVSDGCDTNSPSKKTKSSDKHVVADIHQGPIGLRWDPNDYSCAYDTTVSILYNLWRYSPDFWTEHFTATSCYLQTLANEFMDVGRGEKDLNAARNVVRRLLNSTSDNDFPFGRRMCDMGDLVRALLSQSAAPRGIVWCSDCQRVYPSPMPFMAIGAYTRMAPKGSIAESIHHLQSGIKCCPQGHVSGWLQHEFGPWIWIQTEGSDDYNVSIMFNNAAGSCTYRLAGITYLGDNHFVTRIIDGDGSIYFHDSMSPSQRASYEGNAKVGDWSRRLLKTTDGKTAVVYVYVRVAHHGWSSGPSGV